MRGDFLPSVEDEITPLTPQEIKVFQDFYQDRLVEAGGVDDDVAELGIARKLLKEVIKTGLTPLPNRGIGRVRRAVAGTPPRVYLQFDQPSREQPGVIERWSVRIQVKSLKQGYLVVGEEMEQLERLDVIASHDDELLLPLSVGHRQNSIAESAPSQVGEMELLGEPTVADKGWVELLGWK